MAYDSLKNIIRQYIKTNGEQEITGQIMQNVLIEMVNNYPSTEGFIRANLSNLANGDILIYDSVGAWYNTPLSSFFNGYATKLWVNQQGYVTSSALAGYIHPTITDLDNGDILIWDSVGSWVNAPLDTTISGFGYVKSTGSVAYATSAGSANILSHSVYENPAHALANGDMLVYDSGTGWTNVETSSILSGYATQSWVNQQGFLTSSALNGYIHPTLTNLANGDILIYDSVGAWVNASLDTTVAGFGYITSSALNGYATQIWVNTQLAGYLPLTGGTMSGDIIMSTDHFIQLTQGGEWSNIYRAIPFSNVADYRQIAYVSNSLLFNPSTNRLQTGGLTLTNGYLILDGQSEILSTAGLTQIVFGNNGTEHVVLSSNDKAILINPSSSSTAGQIKLGVGNTNSYFNNSVGIGTTSPAYKLDVNGTLNATTIYQNGTAISSIYLAPILSNLTNGDVLVYDSVGAWYNTPMSSFLSGYATESWVGQQGYLTNSALAGYIHPTLTNLANGDILIYDSVGAWVNAPLDTTISGFGYVKSTGSVAYATSAGSANILGHTVYENQAHSLTNGDMLVYDNGTGWTNVETSSILSGYATQSWVNQQGFLTSSALNGYIHPTLTNLANGDILIYDSVGAWVNASLDTTVAGFGYITSSALNGYATQIWVNTQLAGYLPLTGGTMTGDIIMSTDHFIQLTQGSNWSNIYRAIPFSKTADYRQIAYVSNSLLFNPATNRLQTGGLTLTNGYLILDGQIESSSTAGLTQIVFGNNGTEHVVLSSNDKAILINPSSSSTAGQIKLGVGNTNSYFNNSVGIGTSSPAYKLDVNGSANATTLYENGSRVITTANIGSQSVNYATSAGSANILGNSVTLNSAHSLSNGDILVYDSVGSWTNVSSGLSDIRQKDVINYNAEPTFEAVANAPAIKFTYKDNTYSFRRGIHVGSIAQYWQTTLPETVSMDNDGMLSMQYDVIALLSTISVAKKVSEHERRIVILERENEELRKELAALKSA